MAPVGNTAPFQEMLQRWRAVGNTVSYLTGPRFEPPTSRFRDERVTALPTARLVLTSQCDSDSSAHLVLRESLPLSTCKWLLPVASQASIALKFLPCEWLLRFDCFGGVSGDISRQTLTWILRCASDLVDLRWKNTKCRFWLLKVFRVNAT